DHLVSTQEDRGRHLKADRSRGLQIDDGYKFRRLLHRKVGRLRTSQNLIHKGCCMTPHVGKVDAVAHKASSLCEFNESAPGEPVFYRKLCTGLCIVDEHWLFHRDERADWLGGHRDESAFEIGWLAYRKLREFELERLSRELHGRQVRLAHRIFGSDQGTCLRQV